MRNALKLATAFAALALLTTSASAQRAMRQQGAPAVVQGVGNPIEFGIDGDISFHLLDENDGDDITQISLPNAIFRMGFHRNATWSIEPYASIQAASTDNVSERNLMLGVGLPWHLSTVRTMNQWYVRPFVGFTSSRTEFETPTGDIENTATQFHLGAGFGLKMPIADRLGARFEVLLARTFEDEGDAPGFTTVGLRGGLSFYTR